MCVERTIEILKAGLILKENYPNQYREILEINYNNRWYNIYTACVRIYDKWNSTPEEEMEFFTSKGYLYEFMTQELEIVLNVLNEFINEFKSDIKE